MDAVDLFVDGRLGRNAERVLVAESLVPLEFVLMSLALNRRKEGRSRTSVKCWSEQKMNGNSRSAFPCATTAYRSVT